MIDLDLVSEKKQYLYHLTSRVNLPSIVACGALWSASVLFERAHGAAAARDEIRRRRPGPGPTRIEVDGQPVEIRDQHTISEIALPKCLEDGGIGDYYELLNGRVFLWPTVERLTRHYARYAAERPVLLRFTTRDLLALNPHVEFSRLNSGATRPNSHLGGIAPKRGRNTFQPVETCNLKIAQIAEVTFPERCRLTDVFWTASKPEGPWRLVTTRE
jgi:uncharacterized protein DUF7002